MAGRTDSVPLDDRGLAYGDGLFETIAVRNGEPRLLALHLARIADGCRRLAIEYPGDSAVNGLVVRVLQDCNVSTAYCTLKLVVTAGSSPRGYLRNSESPPRLLVGVFPSSPLPHEHYTNGVVVDVSAIRLAVQPLLAGLKTLNRLEQVLARNAIGEGFEALMLDTEGHVVCGTMSNMILEFEEGLVTPSLAQCGVEGVMRNAILAGSNGSAVTVRPVWREELEQASAMVLCNSQFGVLPVARLGTRPLESLEAAALLRAGLAEQGVVEP